MKNRDGPAPGHIHHRPVTGFAARVFIETTMAAHLVAAAYYWWLSPKGFPMNHSRFWLNSVLPIAVLAAAMVALAGILQQRHRTLSAAMVGFASAWFAAALAGRLLFPASLRGFWLVGLVAALSAAVGPLRHKRLPAHVWLSVSIVCAFLGAFVVWAQVPPSPATNPMGIEPVDPDGGQEQALSPPMTFDAGHRFYPATAELTLKRDRVTIRCSTRLSFDRISPDGFWSLLAPDEPRTRDLQRHTRFEGRHIFHYADNSRIELPESFAAERMELTAFSTIERDTFSHLNSFCDLNVAGHKKLSLAFSPCNDTLIDVLPADYPTGRPARFAYLDEPGRFVVAEATSGEKGPFHQLASGSLNRGDPLTISLHDDGGPVASITFDDWTQQLSTNLSPTAGWGVPVNAIEFQRLGTSEEAPATIWITLAATSVGRGWESVGHRAGTYRNRMVFRVEPF